MVKGFWTMWDNFKVMVSILLTAGLPFMMWVKEFGTPLVVFLAAVFGLGAGIYNFFTSRNKYKKSKERENEKD
jgi:hypothetical protein